MSESKKARVFAGLSTGVTLEKYARSILEQAQSIEEEANATSGWDERTHIGIQPMLLALSMEFALKAWFTYDHDRNDPPKTHNLKRLFDKLNAASRERLDLEFRKTVAPLHPIIFCTDYSIADLLDHHANAFVQWRYLHEKRDGGISFNSSAFIATLELVLNEYRKRYENRRVSQ